MNLLTLDNSSLSQLGFAVWIWDLPNDKLEWSQAMFELFGVEKSDFNGAYDAWERTLHPDDKEKAVSTFKDAIQKKILFDTSFRIISPSKGIRHIAAKGIVECASDGSPVLVRGINWDITESVVIAENLSDLNTSYESVIGALEEGIVVQNLDGLIFKSNKAALKILDLTEDELHGRTSLDPRWKCIRLDGSPFEGKDHPVPVAIKTQQIQKDVLMGVQRKDATLSWISITAVPRFDASEKIKDVVATFVDVTAKVNLQIELENQARFQSAVLDSSTYMFIATDPNGIITLFNSAAEAKLGYKASEVVGKITPEFIHDKDEVVAHSEYINEKFGIQSKPGFDTFIHMARKFKVEERNWTYIRKDGTRFPVNLAVTVLQNTQGEITGYLGVATDLTKQRELEFELERNTKGMIRNAKLATLGELTAGISHEINNPLTIIIGKTEQIKYMISDGDPKEQIFVELDKIQTSTERISKIIKSLKYFSKSNNDSKLEQFDMGEIITDAYGLLKERMSKRNIEFIFKPTSKCFIEGYKNLLLQTLINILTNSIEALEILSEKWIRVELEMSGQSLNISVTDSGLGIEDHVVQKMMMPFFTTKDIGQGTGMGLSISLGNVQYNGGHLTYSLKDNHTCFNIELPISQQKPI
jgi:PAS domain S-box-containing protein